jgi:hypothetical protein
MLYLTHLTHSMQLSGDNGVIMLAVKCMLLIHGHECMWCLTSIDNIVYYCALSLCTLLSLALLSPVLIMMHHPNSLYLLELRL